MGKWIALCSLLLISVVDVAAAQNPLIAQGEQQVSELRFEEALQSLSAALVRPDNTMADESLIYRLLSFTYLALGREVEATGAYRHMLAIMPDYRQGEDVSPRIRDFFERVREEWVAAGRPGSGPPPTVTIQHRSPPQGERGESVTLHAEIVDEGQRVARVVLAYRRGSEAVFQRIDAVAQAGEYSAHIPGEDVGPPLVEYYFEALDADGLPVAARGDISAPLRIAVAAEADINVVEEWWFWTGIGVLVAGAVAAGVGIAIADSNSTNGTILVRIGE